MIRRALALLVTMLAATATAGSAHADDDDMMDAGADATPADTDPGPKLPNGEPAPQPDLQQDAGGCSCRTARVAASPLPLALIGALFVRRARARRRGTTTK